MAGIYLHIPFCKSRCAYCDFYSTTALSLRRRYVDALCAEYRMRASYLQTRVRTIYIGGGTPSMLEISLLRQIFDALGALQAEEVTMECNPDDLTDQYVASLALLPVNRISMGAQTFSDHRLRFLRRRHTSNQVREAVARLRSAGIDNISIDLIYGFPGETLDEWHADVDAALSLDVEHISAYALQYEEGTALHSLLRQGLVSEVDEELSRQMYFDLIDRLRSAGFEHYEISNFAKKNRRSLHNSGYWNHTPYLGLGAAAHSFDGESRQWNVADIRAYMAGMEAGSPRVERETLDAATLYNEQVMTALRTCEGLALSELAAPRRSYCLQQARQYVEDGLLNIVDDRLVLTREGLFVSDMIISDLMDV